MSQLQMSACGFRRVLKLARTIADLADSETVQPAHLAEALHLRPAETTELVFCSGSCGPPVGLDRIGPD